MAPSAPRADVARRAADVRHGEPWTSRQRAKNDRLHVAIRAALRVLRPLPASALRLVALGAAVVALVAFGSARRTAYANVHRVLGLRGFAASRFVARNYARLARHLGDTLALLGDRPAALLPMAARDRAVLQEAIDEGRGVVLPAAHLGPWEHVAATLVAAGFPLTTLARESYDPRLDAIYARLRRSEGARHGVDVVYRGAEGAPVRIVRALRRGRVLGAPMDLRSRVPSIDVPFLAHDAKTPLGPARLALRLRAPVVVCTIARPANGVSAVTCTRLETSDLRADPDGVAALTRRINDELSRRILATPLDWPWMHPRFDA